MKGLCRFYYGWVIVAGIVWVLGIGVGITFYGLSVYLTALSDGAGGAFSISTVSAATGVFLLVSGGAGMGVATLLRRFDPRIVLFSGLVVSAAAVLLIGQALTVWQLYLSYAFLGCGFSAISVIPASHLLSTWFVRRRTVAMSVAFTGLPLGGAVMTPPIAALVEARGIEGASPWLAAALILLAGPVTILLKPNPESRGTRTQQGTESPSAVRASSGVDMRAAVRSPWFILVTAALALGMFGQLGTLSHLYNAVGERLPSAAAAAVSLVGASSLVGRLIGSWMLSRVSLRSATVALLLLQTGSVVLLAFTHELGGFIIAAVGFGLTTGNMQVIQPLLLVEQFGIRDFAAILARNNLLVMLGMAAGPPVIGVLHDAWGTYHLPLTVAAVSALLGAVLMACSGRLELTRRN